MAESNDKQQDIDPTETQEWQASLASVLEREGPERAHFLLERLIEQARRNGAYIPFSPNTAYVNTIPPHREAKSPGDAALEWKIRSLVRWNAMALVINAARDPGGLEGHIASFASAATLYEVGFNHFFRGPEAEGGGDLVFFQGHSAEGFYARAYLEGRLSEAQLRNFRQEVKEGRGKGLSSYPHPWLMPEFWQFATVSMGLGPIQAIYQARFLKYLENRGLAATAGRKVWCFLGDGETDEPETLGAIGLASRENLDNLIFVVNCNLQRLDGPVRGDSKIIQELEGRFRGSGWNVLKVIWGSYWDPLFAADTQGLLRRRMDEAVDGLYQACKARGGAYTREHFFGAYPELKELVAHLTDDDIARLNRGGHDPHKIYAAYAAAAEHSGQPTVILAKTVKGYGMGEAGEAQNITHQKIELDEGELKRFRDRFQVPIPDEQIKDVPFYRPPEDSPEIQYLKARRQALGGALPARRGKSTKTFEVPPLESFSRLLEGGERPVSTTMVFVRMLQQLVRDKTLGPRVVPIVPDEARTFGMEGLFRAIGVYSPLGQLYEPEDAGKLAFYREAQNGQILEEGITEAGAMSSWIAAATSYSVNDEPMIPFYIFYSMFGFQRTGDLCWAAGDMRSRGFLLGATSGRTTLNGEGLQHEDGNSQLFFSVVPNCRSYDPTFGYELITIIQDGMRRMLEDQEDVYYYLTVMNENYPHPPMPEGEGVRDGIIRGLYRFSQGDKRLKTRVQLMGSGVMLREAIAAAELLKDDWKVGADVWSAPSFNQLARDGAAAERHNRLHPGAKAQVPYVTQCLHDAQGPVVAATDYVRAYPQQIAPYVPAPYLVLGTDGFGRSDTRARLRHFFEVDRHWITVAALKGLADQGQVAANSVAKAIKRYGLDPDKPNPIAY